MQTTTNVETHGAERISVLLDIRGAGLLLGLSPWQVRGLVASGELNVIRVGRKFYFRRSTILRWAERSEGRAA